MFSMYPNSPPHPGKVHYVEVYLRNKDSFGVKSEAGAAWSLLKETDLFPQIPFSSNLETGKMGGDFFFNSS